MLNNMQVTLRRIDATVEKHARIYRLVGRDAWYVQRLIAGGNDWLNCQARVRICNKFPGMTVQFEKAVDDLGLACINIVVTDVCPDCYDGQVYACHDKRKPLGECFRCRGKGWQSPDDVARNAAYDAHQERRMQQRTD